MPTDVRFLFFFSILSTCGVYFCCTFNTFFKIYKLLNMFSSNTIRVSLVFLSTLVSKLFTIFIYFYISYNFLIFYFLRIMFFILILLFQYFNLSLRLFFFCLLLVRYNHLFFRILSFFIYNFTDYCSNHRRVARFVTN